MEYTISTITENDRNEVFEFVKEHFGKEEPLTKSMGTDSFQGNVDFFLQGIPQKCCFKVVTEEGQLIGVILSSITSKEYESIKLNPVNDKINKIVYLMDTVAEQSKIFEKYPTYLDGKIICVHREHGGKGIAGELLKKVQEFMCEHNIPAMIRVCTSHFSARAMKKLGMKEVHTLFYDEFKDKYGEIVFTPEKPHIACRTMVMEI